MKKKIIEILKEGWNEGQTDANIADAILRLFREKKIIMKPEVKAKQLINLFKAEQPMYLNEDEDDETETEKHDNHFGKRCALHCVDEIVRSHSSGNWKGLDWDNYWREVKKHIVKLK